MNQNIKPVVSTIALIAACLAAGAFHASAYAHGCSGNQACTQDTTITNHNSNPFTQVNPTVSPEQTQHQHQHANAHANTHNASTIDASQRNNSRYLSVRPVVVPASPTVSPSATISRYADAQCGPRMKVVRREVKGLNNRIWSTKEVDVGFAEYVVPDEDRPYRQVPLSPDFYQLIGHRVVDAATVVNISTSYGLGIGGNNSAGAGASVGAQGSNSLQSMINQVILVECVAFEVDTRPLQPRG